VVAPRCVFSLRREETHRNDGAVTMIERSLGPLRAPQSGNNYVINADKTGFL
jgi:hypothetical protein